MDKKIKWQERQVGDRLAIQVPAYVLYHVRKRDARITGGSFPFLKDH